MSIHVSKIDPRLKVEKIQYLGETGQINAHLAKPKEIDKLPGVVVIHENRGLTPHIEEVARRIALEGYIALAPDALSPFGGTPEDSDEARDLIGKLDPEKNTKNFVAAVKYLKAHPQSTGKVGVTGFCWGGGVTNQVAVNSPDIQAAAPFYGRQPEARDVPKIKASMLLHYAGDDERINAGIKDYVEALEAAKIEHETIMYEGAKHAFFNDTSQRYDEKAARLAWEKTIEFFNDKLKT